ncbi:MAG: hypothetical protein KDD40_11640, partial [Bdellovibrionales bacterium]|nr:hypothetical protein [Bdellovibrionales bacterium]
NKFGFLAALEALRKLDSKTQSNILKNVAKKSPKLANELKSQLFTMNDLQRINPQGIQLIVSLVNLEELTLCLINILPETLNYFCNALPNRRAAQIKEGISQLGPQPLAKIEKAQKEFIDFIIELKNEGKITIIEEFFNDPLV